MKHIISTTLLVLALVITAVSWLMLYNYARADDGFTLKEVNLEYKDFFPGGSDPLITQNGIPNRQLGKELNLNMNSEILKFLFWDNRVHSMTDEVPNTGGNVPFFNAGKGQFRLVGWNWKLGVRPTGWLDLYYEHYSKHLLDHEYSGGHFPVQDSLGIKIYLYRTEKVNNIFNALFN